MNTLLGNQAFDTALIALIGVITAYISLRVKQAEQGAQLDAVQQQQAKQGSAAVLVTSTGAPTGPLVAASVQCPHCAQQVHLDSLIPAPPAAPADGAPSSSAAAGR